MPGQGPSQRPPGQGLGARVLARRRSLAASALLAACGPLGGLLAAAPAAAQSTSLHKQCRNPLFQTHWAGKIDIQTLVDFPVVQTNLKACPAFNQKSSCCHQTFEMEQRKYFEFWRLSFADIFCRLNAHREAVIAARHNWQQLQLNVAPPPAPGAASELPRADEEQYEVVLQHYAEILSPRLQGRCFSTLLDYVGGMLCFACEPQWRSYTYPSEAEEVQGSEDAAAPWAPPAPAPAALTPAVRRVRMDPPVCIDIWESCKEFGDAAQQLSAAIRDSAVAQGAPLSVERLDMFEGQQQLCDWLHDRVALSPFHLRHEEDSDVHPWRRASCPASAASVAPDVAGDCTCPPGSVCADGGSLKCPWSGGLREESTYFVASCVGCRCVSAAQVQQAKAAKAAERVQEAQAEEAAEEAEAVQGAQRAEADNIARQEVLTQAANAGPPEGGAPGPSPGAQGMWSGRRLEAAAAAAAAGAGAGRSPAGPGPGAVPGCARRLGAMKKSVDVLVMGRQSAFDRAWRQPECLRDVPITGGSGAAAPSRRRGAPAAAAGVLAALGLAA